MPDNRDNLPQPLSSFVGRKREIEELSELIENNRLVTIVGAGGMGKTRLALEVASRLRGSFAGGAWFADLSAVPRTATPDLAETVLSELLPVATFQGEPLDALIAFLRTDRALLVLDNCEQIIDRCAALVKALLGACPTLHILATSRQTLNIEAETIFRLQPLSLPNPARIYKVDELESFEAVQLFLDRARSKRGDNPLTGRNSRAVIELCCALDGMPLALELAAVCLSVLTVEQVVERLDDRFRLLAWGSRTSAPRQQSLRALIDWSYESLSGEEKRLFRAVSVFMGGFTLEGCAAVVAAPEQEFIGSLAVLVDKSLVIHDEKDGVSRYRLLETIRHYALDKLRQSNEEVQARDRHLAYFLGMAQSAARELSSQAQADWVGRFGSEYENFRAALAWAATTPERAAMGLQIGWDLKWFWVMCGRLEEERSSVSRVIDTVSAGESTQELARALNTEALLAWYIGDDEAAGSGYEHALTMGRSLGDLECISFSLKGLGNLARRQGNLIRAQALCEEALNLDEQIGDPASIALSLLSLGRVAGQRGTYRDAMRWLKRSLVIFEGSADFFGMASVKYEMAMVALEREAFGKAVDLAMSSLEVFRDLEVKFRAAQCLFLLAEIAARSRQAGRAAVLYGAAETFLTDIGASLHAREKAEREQHEAAARIQISNEAWESAWYRGASMSIPEAVEYARAMLSRAERVLEEENIEDQPPHMSLSVRELEVLRLIADNMSAAEVAGKLSISPRTVEAHVHSIYTKLEIKGRKELVRYAQENKLV